VHKGGRKTAIIIIIIIIHLSYWMAAAPITNRDVSVSELVICLS